MGNEETMVMGVLKIMFTYLINRPSLSVLLLIVLLSFSSHAASPQFQLSEPDVVILKSGYLVSDTNIDGEKVYRRGSFVKRGEAFYWFIDYRSKQSRIPYTQIVESDVPGNWTMTLGNEFEVSDDRRVLTHKSYEDNSGSMMCRWTHDYTDPSAHIRIKVKLGDAPLQVFEYEGE